MVIYHVDDALHAPAVDLLHQVDKILHAAVLGVHGTVVAVGIRAAQAPLSVQNTDGVDGHQPDNIHPQRPDAVQIGLHRPEGSLGGVAAQIKLIDHTAAQRTVGFMCHMSASFFGGLPYPVRLWVDYT